MWSLFTRFRVCVFLALLTCLTNIAHAGLTGPPESYVQPIDDGKHMLVMFSPAAVMDDTGNEATLPGGQTVKLRDTFPTSGLYEIGLTEPVWEADWYGQHGLVVLSQDGRYAVSINLFGDGQYPTGPTSWGIKFYDRGVEIKRHDVAELVDYPSLMEFTTTDWHFLWIDDSVPQPLDGRYFTLRTSTRATFRFDITTGEIVEEHRFWRRAARMGIVVLVVVGVLAAAAVGLRLGRSDLGTFARESVSNEEPPELSSAPKTRSYSLRSLFVLMTVVAVICWIPHIAMFAVSLVGAVRTTRWSRRRRMRKASLGRLRRLAAGVDVQSLLDVRENLAEVKELDSRSSQLFAGSPQQRIALLDHAAVRAVRFIGLLLLYRG